MPAKGHERLTEKSQAFRPGRPGEIFRGIRTTAGIDFDGVDPRRRIPLGRHQRDHAGTGAHIQHPRAVSAAEIAEIAQADLEFRGAGDVLGDAQSGGKSGLKLLRVVKDVKIIEEARAEAAKLVAEDPTLRGYVQLAGAVLDFTRGNETFLTSN